MPSRNRPDPEFPDRVLSATLARVRKRRSRRRQAVAFVALLIGGLAGSLALWHRGSLTNAGGEVIVSVPGPESARILRVHVERIPERPLRVIDRSSRVASIERITASASPRSTRIIRLSEEAFFAALPPDQPVALIRKADGTARLFVLD